MAQILGMQVVAEGVELPDQLSILRELGCEFGQGYLSRALGASDAERFLHTSVTLTLIFERWLSVNLKATDGTVISRRRVA